MSNRNFSVVSQKQEIQLKEKQTVLAFSYGASQSFNERKSHTSLLAAFK